MPALQQHFVQTGFLSSVAGTVVKGQCLVLDTAGTRLLVSTSANRTATGRKTACIALQNGDEENAAIETQFGGVLDPSVANVGEGTQGQTVYVDANGDLARGGTVGVDDIIGRCDADGVVYFLCGGIAGAAGGDTVPGGSDAELQYRSSATAFGAVPWNYRGTSVAPGGDVRAAENAKQSVLNGAVVKNVWTHEGGSGLDSYLTIGITGPSETDTSLTHDYTSIGAQKQLSLNIYNDEHGTEASLSVISENSSTGLAPNGGIIGLPNLTVGSGAYNFSGSFGGGVGVLGIQKASTNPATPYTHGSIVYCNASSSNDLFYLRSDGTVVPMGAAFTNAGTGEGTVYKSTSGITHSLKTIKAGSNVTITNNTNDITIAASGGTSITGSDTHVLFFDGANTPAGDAGFTYNKTTDTATLAGALVAGTYVGIAGSAAATGQVRLAAAASTDLIMMRYSGADYNLAQINSGTDLVLGNTTFVVDLKGYRIDIVSATGDTRVYGANTLGMTFTSSKVQTSLPIAGDQGSSVPFRFKRVAITKNDTTDLTLSAAQYECVLIDITGSSGGAFNIIAPDLEGAMFNIRNAVTGGNATIKKSGGTGVAVTSGTVGWYAHNGSDYEAR